MALAPGMIPYMVGGYAVDRMMGGSGMTGLALGTGVGGMGGFGGIAESLGMSGISALPSATASNSLGGGAALLGGGAGIPASTAVASTTPVSLLGSANGNANNLYNIGMNGVTGSGSAVTGGIADLEAYTGLQGATGEIGADMSFTKKPYGTANFGTAQTPNNVGAHLTSDAAKQNLVETGLDTSRRDIYNQAEQFRPRFGEVTKSSAEEITERTGGYEAPLHERMMSSMVDFAKENPLAIASLGLTAFDDSGEQQPVTSGSVGSIARTAYNPPRSQLVKIQRA